MTIITGQNGKARWERAGGALVYCVVALMAMLMFASIAVDYGRTQLVKTELRRAVDAASRYGVTGCDIDAATARSRCIAAAAENKVDGQPLVLTSADIEFGVWDPATRNFTVLTGSAADGATAIRVTGQRTAARSTAIPTLFARILGRTSVDVTAQAIVARGNVKSAGVDADSCLWLAGMPNGSTVANSDDNPTPIYAPAQSPYQMGGIPLTAGAKLSFRQASGNTGFVGGSNIGPDGDPNWLVTQYPVNGINSTTAPIACMVGIFLDDRAPNTYAQKSALDFSTVASRDFTTLSPQVKQVFFIGDGVNSANQLQQFVVPTGATRLYIGVMDEKGWWWDNYGTINWTMLDQNITTVK